MSKFQIEYDNVSISDLIGFLFLTKTHKYTIPGVPPERTQWLLVDTEDKTVTFHGTALPNTIPTVTAMDDTLIAAVIDDASLQDNLSSLSTLARVVQPLADKDKEMYDTLKKMEQLKGEISAAMGGEKNFARKEDCKDAQHIRRKYEFDGRTVEFNTCMACARAAAAGDTGTLAMFMAHPVSVRAFIQDFVDMHDAKAAQKH